MLMLAEQPSQTEYVYETTIKHYAPMIRAYCGRELCPADADDATQAVFLVLWKKGPTLDPTTKLSSWLFGVARNVVRNARRDKQRRQHAEQGAGEELAMQAQPEELNEDNQSVKRLINQVITELPNREREVVELYYLAGHTYAEIATATNSKTSTVAAKVQRGLDRMRTLLKKRGVVVPLALLSSTLQAAQEPVAISRSLMQTLMNQAPSADLSAITTPEIPAHIMRWSHQGSKIMTTIYGGIAACFLTAGLFLYAGAAEEDNNTVKLDEIGDVAMDTSLVIRFNNPQRTLQRFADSPYGALIKVPGHEFPEEMTPGTQYSWLAMDPNSFMTRAQREKLHAFARKQAKAPVSEYFNLPADFTEETMQSPLLKGDEKSVSVGPKPGLVFNMKGHFETGNQEIFNFIVNKYASDSKGSSFYRQDYSNGSVTIDKGDTGFTINSKNINSVDILEKIPTPEVPLFENADIEFYNYAHPLNEADFSKWMGQDTKPFIIQKGSLTFTKQGLKVFMQSAYPAMPQRPDIKAALGNTATITPNSFARVPSNAVAAFSTARSSGSLSTGSLWLTMVRAINLTNASNSNNVEIEKLLDEAVKTFNTIEGDIIGYAQMGAMTPELTLIIPNDLNQSLRLINLTKKAFPNFNKSSTDVTVHYSHMMGNISIGHRGDSLYITTSALGIDHIHNQPGGFDTQPSVKHALAQLANPTNGQIIIRDRAIGDFIKPFLGMQPAAIKTTGLEIINDLPEQAGYLRWYENETGMTIEGDGALNAFLLPTIVPALGEILSVVGNG